MSKPNGGNAFPLPLGTMNCAEPEQSGGMTLRDYFAAAALQGLLAGESPENGQFSSHEGAAISAYRYSDAMLAERDK